MWLQLMVGLVLGGTAASEECPDGRKCEGLYTCCLLSEQDGYACCTQSQPLGTPLRMLPPSAANGSSALCPDGRMCPEQHSCLGTVDASFGCCPWEKAISCADGRHCCPLGSHCSVGGKSCFQHEVLTSVTLIGAVPCPDGESECPNDSTCCLMPDGAWGCCPMPEAACCPDKIHCCPHGTTCDLEHARCYAPSGTLPILKKFPAMKQALRTGLDPLSLFSVSAVFKAEGPLEGDICRHNSACPDSATCCLLPLGQYGCCPLQNAVCCGDRLHCCPQGTQCDLTHSRCTMTSRWSWPLTHLLVDFQRATDVQCDAEHKCPDDNTCCPKGSSSWGCCPLAEATCCQDGLHCCPSGYRCDLSQGGCVKDRESVPWREKSPAVASLSRDVKCDAEFSCSDQQTCCRMKSGRWACCPFSEATCCQDGLHCCPSGYRCDLSQGSCVKGRESVPWQEKKLAVVSLSRDVKCDDEFSCPEGQTCCRMKSGAWACCPFSEAVCCDDHQHCCPSGYTCNVAAQTCEKRQEAWLLPSGELLASSLMATSGRDVSCDPQHYCHDRQTCCKASSGGWACCPYDKGSCCSDRRHCCPPGFRCSSSGFECIKQKPLQWAANVLPPDSVQERPRRLL